MAGFGFGVRPTCRRHGAAAAAPLDITGTLPDADGGVEYLSSGELAVAGGTGPFTVELLGAPAGMIAAMSGRDIVVEWSSPA